MHVSRRAEVFEVVSRPRRPRDPLRSRYQPTPDHNTNSFFVSFAYFVVTLFGRCQYCPTPLAEAADWFTLIAPV